jgi:DNA replication protein DnaC
MLLLQAERDTRTTNRNNRLVKEADFRYSATLEQLQAGSHRGVDRTIIKLVAKISRVDLLIIDNLGCKH